MEDETQISALVSRTTKELLERHVRATGVKKGHLVEQALRHHLQALQELPADIVIHPKLVVKRKSGDARLGVDQPAQGQGLGVQLLRFVLQLALGMADDYGCVGVIVDAKPDASAFYAKYGFVKVDAVEGRSDARPAPTPMFLSIRAVKGALGAS